MASISVSLGADAVGGTTDWWNECKEVKLSLLTLKLKLMEADEPGSNGLTLIHHRMEAEELFQRNQ